MCIRVDGICVQDDRIVAVRVCDPTTTPPERAIIPYRQAVPAVHSKQWSLYVEEPAGQRVPVYAKPDAAPVYLATVQDGVTTDNLAGLPRIPVPDLSVDAYWPAPMALPCAAMPGLGVPSIAGVGLMVGRPGHHSYWVAGNPATVHEGQAPPPNSWVFAGWTTAPDSPRLHGLQLSMRVPAWTYPQVFLDHVPGEPGYTSQCAVPGPGESGQAPAIFDYDPGLYPPKTRIISYRLTIGANVGVELVPGVDRRIIVRLYAMNRRSLCAWPVADREIRIRRTTPEPRPQPVTGYQPGAFTSTAADSPAGYSVEIDRSSFRVCGPTGSLLYRGGRLGQGAVTTFFNQELPDSVAVLESGIPFSQPQSEEGLHLIFLHPGHEASYCQKKRFFDVMQSPDGKVLSAVAEETGVSGGLVLCLFGADGSAPKLWIPLEHPNPAPVMLEGDVVSYWYSPSVRRTMPLG